MTPDTTRLTAAISALRAILGDDAKDEGLWIDTLEGETDLHSVIAALVKDEAEAAAAVDMLDSLIDGYELRKARQKARIKAIRETMTKLMEMADLRTLKLPEATLSFRTLPPKPEVFAPEDLPMSCTKTVRVPDMDAIRAECKSGRIPFGVRMTNGAPSVTVRRA